MTPTPMSAPTTPSMTADGPLDGVLPVDKPRGPTSHDVVAAARRALRTRRIGHTGTLDPFASGLLLLCIGPSTRIAEYLTSMDKSYRALVRLGARTDTDDDTGTVLERHDPVDVRQADVERALDGLRGTIEQVPPQYSAKKVGGVRAHRIARAGGTAPLPAVRVTVHAIDIVRFDGQDVELDIRCSSGTYIRSVARDLGTALGVGAHLTALRRTAIGDATVDDAVPLAALMEQPAEAVARLIPPLDALSGLTRVDVDDGGVEELRHGRSISCGSEQGIVAIAAHDRLVALAEAGGGRLQPRKVFV